MGVKISFNNTKLGTFIPSVSVSPCMSCRKDAPCKKECYAQRGNFTFPNVVKSMSENYTFYRNYPREYFNDILRQIKSNMIEYRYFRWHVGGDIVDSNYLIGMVWIARQLPRTRFLCFTKKFQLVNDWLCLNELPKNLRIIFSAWDKNFIVDNPFALPVAYVSFKDKTRNPLIPELAIPCKGDCEHCLSCWTLKNGQNVYFDEH